MNFTAKAMRECNIEARHISRVNAILTAFVEEGPRTKHDARKVAREALQSLSNEESNGQKAVGFAGIGGFLLWMTIRIIVTALVDWWFKPTLFGSESVSPMVMAQLDEEM
jgi:hypothetical protein